MKRNTNERRRREAIPSSEEYAPAYTSVIHSEYPYQPQSNTSVGTEYSDEHKRKVEPKNFFASGFSLSERKS